MGTVDKFSRYVNCYGGLRRTESICRLLLHFRPYHQRRLAERKPSDPTSRLTGREDCNETLARELFLKNLALFENRFADEDFDLCRVGYSMDLGSSVY